MNIIAHRGYHNKNIPENSILAFKKAINYGYMIELDVHRIKDGSIVVFHDFNLKRMCDIDKLLEDCTYKELLKYNLLNTKEKIPLLKTVLNLVNGKVPILIETKQAFFNGKLEESICKLLDNYNGEVYIHSFNVLSVLWFKKNMKYVKRGILYNDNNKSFLLDNILFKYVLINIILKVDFISCNKKSLEDNYIKKNKLTLFCWTIKNKKEFNYYNKMSDKLICDNIDELI